MGSRQEKSTTEVWTSLKEWLAQFESEGGLLGSISLVDSKDASELIRLCMLYPAGRTLIAVEDIPTNTGIINLPRRALLNRVTLKDIYETDFSELSSTQWLSLHLAIQFDRQKSRQNIKKGQAVDFYWPYLESLPRDFPTIPLWWSEAPKNSFRDGVLAADRTASMGPQSTSNENIVLGEDLKRYGDLLRLLPSSVQNLHDKVLHRFILDWEVVQTFWQSYTSHENASSGQLTYFDFLVGWLNVNTRCVYLDLGLERSENLTLAPVIDMINHCYDRASTPKQTGLGLSFTSPTHKTNDPQISHDDELGFCYGPHEDAQLFAEYGFVLGAENPHNFVDISKVVMDLISNGPKENQSILEGTDYWGDYRLQSQPQPASCCWRTLVSLRLHFLPEKPNALRMKALEIWHDMVAGERDIVSEVNERQSKEAINRICREMIAKNDLILEDCVQRVDAWSSELRTSRTDTLKPFIESLTSIITLRTTESQIAQSVVNSFTSKKGSKQ